MHSRFYSVRSGGHFLQYSPCTPGRIANYKHANKYVKKSISINNRWLYDRSGSYREENSFLLPGIEPLSSSPSLCGLICHTSVRTLNLFIIIIIIMPGGGDSSPPPQRRPASGGNQPAIQWYRCPSPGLKRVEREANKLPSSSSDVRNPCNICSCFHNILT
jgi:hypothetical protein